MVQFIGLPQIDIFHVQIFLAHINQDVGKKWKRSSSRAGRVSEAKASALTFWPSLVAFLKKI